MSETKTYVGSCHCGKVRYEVDLAPLDTVAACNCSICSRRGWLLASAPLASVRVLSGEGETTDYQFGKKIVHHLFCKTCGVSAYTHGKGRDGQEVAAINVRCLEGVEIEKLTVKHYDGRHL